MGAGAGGIAITPDGKTAYVISSLGVTPINTATNNPGKLIKIPGGDIAITPDGKTAYVAAGSGTVTPVRIATNRVLKPIHVGTNASHIAITPDGKTAYVTSNLGVTPINTATNKPGTLIKIPGGDIAITPNGKTAYVTSSLGVTPINIATNKPGKLIKVAGGAGLIVITP